MWKQNNILFGFILAMFTTAASFGLLWILNEYVLGPIIASIAGSTGRKLSNLQGSTLVIIALGLNIFVLNFYTRFNAYKTGRGILLFTFACAIFIVIYFFGEDLGIRPRTSPLEPVEEVLVHHHLPHLS